MASDHQEFEIHDGGKLTVRQMPSDKSKAEITFTSADGGSFRIHGYTETQLSVLVAQLSKTLLALHEWRIQREREAAEAEWKQREEANEQKQSL